MLCRHYAKLRTLCAIRIVPSNINNQKSLFMATILKKSIIKIFLLTGIFIYTFVSVGHGQSIEQRNLNVITNYFDQMINSHNINRHQDFFLPDYILHTMDGKSIHSSQDSLHVVMLKWLFSAIPDVHYKIEHILSQGDMVAVNTSATGNAKSEMFGLSPGQKQVRYQQMFFYRLKDGKILEQWETVDPGGIKAQLESK
jgi:predicted ester cyclase